MGGLCGAPEFIKQPIILSVSSDPEPNHLVTFKQTEGTICECYPNGVDRLVVMDFLQAQAHMSGIGGEKAISLLSKFTNFGR